MKLKIVTKDSHPVKYAPELASSSAFITHLSSMTIPESLFLFTPGGTLPSRHIVERAVPGLAGIKLTAEALNKSALFMLRLLSAELMLPVRFLINELGFVPEQPVSWSAYFAKAGCPGLLPPHEDTHDVHVFQIFGERVWQVGETRYELKAGDVLRIPLGTRHQVLETPADSLHITVGVHYPTTHSILRDYTENRRSRVWMAQTLDDPKDFEAHLDKAITDYLRKT